VNRNGTRAARRFLMYSQDGMGLGHLRRSSNIAGEIVAREPSSDVLILADSPATRVLTLRAGIDVVKLPTIVKVGSASWKPTAWRNGSLSMDIRRVMRLRRQLIMQTFREFRPDVFLVDHMPLGALGELRPTFDFALERSRHTRLVLGLRDILDTPAVIRRAWAELGAYDYLSAYDRVLIYGERELYDSAAAYRISARARDVAYCSYVSTPLAPLEDDAGGDELPFILVTGGGGADAYPLADIFLQALPMVRARLPVKAVILTGPNMKPAERAALVARSSPDTRIETGPDKAEGLLRRAMAVISMGGYNTLCELLKLRKKALVVPRPGPSTEQRTRTALFAERGLVRALDRASLEPRRLADELIGLVEDDGMPDVSNIPSLDGARAAAELLLHGAGAGNAGVVSGMVAGDGNGALGHAPGAVVPDTARPRQPS
jgi:predicted glycosyltransferase